MSHALLLSSIIGIASHVIGCGDPKPVESFFEPYQGEIALGEDGVPYQKNRFIVKFEEGSSYEEMSEVITEVGGSMGAYLKSFGIVGVDIEKDLDNAIHNAEDQKGVEIAIRNEYLFEPTTDWDNDSYDPDGEDPQNYGSLWWSRKIELSEGLDLIEDSEVSLSPITVAVIELGGFNDLQEKKEIPYVDAEYHFDFGEGDEDVSADLDDMGHKESHGTSVVSLIAAKNNGKYINGVATNINNETVFQILPIKYHSDDVIDLIKNLGNTLSLMASLNHVLEVAEDTNTRVINMSLGGSLDVVRKGILSALFGDPVKKLNEEKITLVAAAGNSDEDACNNFPSSMEGIIAVGGTARGGTADEEQRWIEATEASNYSMELNCLTVAAPAASVLTFTGTDIDATTGTSFGSPQVAGLVALMKSINPDLTFDEAVNLLRENADDVVLEDDPNPLVQGQIWKRINVRKTMEAMISAGPYCDEYPEENRFVLDVYATATPPTCYGEYGIDLYDIEEGPLARLDILDIYAMETISYYFELGASNLVSLPGEGTMTLELCETTGDDPCVPGDITCTATFSGNKKLNCDIY